MSISPEGYIYRLIECSDRKLSLVKEIYKITKKQSESIFKDGKNIILAESNDKNEIRALVDKQDEDFEVYFKRLKSVLGVKNLEDADISKLPQIKNLKLIIAEIIEVFAKINEMDERNSQKVNEVYNSIGNEVIKVGKAKTASNAYLLKPIIEKGLIDKKK